MEQRQYQRDQRPRHQDRYQDRHQDNRHNRPKQHRPPPPTYCCHKCNQPGHWIIHCPLIQDERERERYGSHHNDHHQQYQGDARDQQWAAGNNRPHDPRMGNGLQSNMSPEDRGSFGYGAQREPYGQAPVQPPMPGGPAPPLSPSHPNDNDSQQFQADHPYKCEPCVKSFPIQSQYESHLKAHIVCSDCDFSAAKRVVVAHWETTHGQYSGDGLKEIDVEGQKFMVLCGNSAEEIAKWRAERRKKWPGPSRKPQPTASVPQPTMGAVAVESESKKRKLSVTSEDLEEGEIEEDEEAKAQQLAKLQAMIPPTAPKSPHEPPAKKPRKTVLCRWFSRGHCRFNAENCKYSHDRSQFACRAMMYKGSCAKGTNCYFSHDPTVLSGQRTRAQAASAERATEQQWQGEQRSLLRKLLAKDVRVEQRKMLQIVHFLVANDFLRSSTGESNGSEAMDVDESGETALGETALGETEGEVKVGDAGTAGAVSVEKPLIEVVLATDENVEKTEETQPPRSEETQAVEVTDEGDSTEAVPVGDLEVVGMVQSSGQESQGDSVPLNTAEGVANVSSEGVESVEVVEANGKEPVNGVPVGDQDPLVAVEPSNAEEHSAAVPPKDLEQVEVEPLNGQANEVSSSGPEPGTKAQATDVEATEA